MPASTGTLLTPEERLAFRAWLDACVARSAVSKTALAKTLGADSTQRFNRYLHDEIPTLPVLNKIVSRLGVSPMIALWKAGYFREHLGIIDELADGPVKGPRRMRHSAILFAVMAFPCRASADGAVYSLQWNDKYRGVAEFMLAEMTEIARSLEPSPLAHIDFDRLGTKPLHPLLAHAAAALALRNVDAKTRRLLAGEAVHAWAYRASDAAHLQWLCDRMNSIAAAQAHPPHSAHHGELIHERLQA